MQNLKVKHNESNFEFTIKIKSHTLNKKKNDNKNHERDACFDKGTLKSL